MSAQECMTLLFDLDKTDKEHSSCTNSCAQNNSFGTGVKHKLQGNLQCSWQWFSWPWIGYTRVRWVLLNTYMIFQRHICCFSETPDKKVNYGNWPSFQVLFFQSRNIHKQHSSLNTIITCMLNYYYYYYAMFVSSVA